MQATFKGRFIKSGLHSEPHRNEGVEKNDGWTKYRTHHTGVYRVIQSHPEISI
jgi:hypothetical protein